MRTCWGSKAAILYFVFVWQLVSAEPSHSESWVPAFQTLATEAPPIDDICPLDFDGLSNFPWVAETCQNSAPDQQQENSTSCCSALLSAMGLAEAELLNKTDIFRLQDVGIVSSCLQQLQIKLESQGVKYKAVETCFPETLWPRFVTNNSLCHGIETAADFEGLVGKDNITKLQRACAGDLTDLFTCSYCNNEMIEVYSLLNILPRNLTELNIPQENITENTSISSDLDAKFLSYCLYDMLLYTAGKATTYEAWSAGTAECIMAVKLTDGGGPLLSVTEIVLISVASFLFSSLLECLVFSIWYRRKKKAQAHQEFIARNKKMLKAAEMPNVGMIKYNYRDIQTATSYFSPKNLLGEGGFGIVYKGILENGLQVAVKRIYNVNDDGDADFLNEVEIIQRVRHRNLVRLRGCSVTSNAEDGHQRLLVYEYMPGGSLDKMLYGQPEGNLLTWANRVKIIVGVAKGLAYLHNDTQPSIIHSDIKPSNILLDDELNAKLADFGLARSSLEGAESQYLTTGRRGGTLGYVAPEYALYGQLTERSDVYSFGVVMLELLSGRKALDPSKQSTPDYSVTEWAASMVQAGKVWEIADERIRFTGPKEKMQTYVMTACMCTQKMVTLRPTFLEVLKYLQGELPLPTMTLPMQQYRFGMDSL